MMQSIGANTKTYSLNSYDHVYAVAEKPLVKNLKMNLKKTNSTKESPYDNITVSLNMLFVKFINLFFLFASTAPGIKPFNRVAATPAKTMLENVVATVYASLNEEAPYTYERAISLTSPITRPIIVKKINDTCSFFIS